MREKFPTPTRTPAWTTRRPRASPRGFVDGHAHQSHRRTRTTAAAVLTLVTAVALALGLDLGRPDFWDPGESRYAETVREMLASGDWLRPTLGFERYYDKPPAYFWIVAGAFRAFGRHEWAARLPSALAAAFTIAWVVGFAWRRVGVRAAILAGFVLATAVQFVALGRSVRMDMLLTALMTATLLHAYRLWETDEPSRAPASWPLYALPALGLLVKGPIAVLLPALIVAAFLAATRTPLTLRRLRPTAGAIAVLALLTAWYLVVAVRAPDYLWTFVFQHNLGRFVGRALAGHHEPVWYYFWILPVTFLPWTLFLPGALRDVLAGARQADRLRTFLLVWCAVPFVFFTLSRAKLATYLLPIFPALALLVAAHLDRVLDAASDLQARHLRVPGLAWVVFMAVVAVGTPIGTAIAYPGYGGHAWPSLLLAIFPLLGWQAIRRAAWDTIPVLVIVATLVTQILFYRVGAPVVNDFSSLRQAAEIARDLPADTAVFAYKTRGHSFTYYGGRTLLRVRSPAAVAEVLGRAAPTAALVKQRHLEKIQQHLRAPVCIWWHSPSGRVLLTNRPRPHEPAGAALLPVAGDGAPSAPSRAAPPC